MLALFEKKWPFFLWRHVPSFVAKKRLNITKKRNKHSIILYSVRDVILVSMEILKLSVLPEIT